MSNKKKWTDETGLELPANRILPLEKMREKAADTLLKKAEIVQKRLVAIKQEFEDICTEVWTASLIDAGADPEKIAAKKGNHTWYNFDRSIKIEVSISERIDFDDALIAAAKEKFDTFLSENINGTEDVIRVLVTDAFSTTRGQLDAKKVMQLIRHRSRIDADKYPGFHRAVDLIEQSIRRPDSKKYFRISTRDFAGRYQNVDLNFSSI